MNALDLVSHGTTLNTVLIRLADSQAKVTGRYYASEFSGTIVLSRQHTINHREIVTITLDKPTLVKVTPRDSGRMTKTLLIEAQELLERTHRLDVV